MRILRSCSRVSCRAFKFVRQAQVVTGKLLQMDLADTTLVAVVPLELHSESIFNRTSMASCTMQVGVAILSAMWRVAGDRCSES